MAQDEGYTFICNQEGRQMLVILGEKLPRSQSDVVSMHIRER